MMALGWASIVLIIGFVLRAKSRFLQKMLVPASVLGGIVGFSIINILGEAGGELGVNADHFAELMNHLFTLSFIAMSLSDTSHQERSNLKETVRGALGMGILWCLLYLFTPLVGAGVIALLGGSFDLSVEYGTLIPFAFAQGPGQAAAYGKLYENYGYENATMVALSFAALGYLASFLMGIPAAKLGMQKGIARNCAPMEESVRKGYWCRSQSVNVTIKDTTCSSNMETLSLHFAVIGVCYMSAILISRLFSLLPGFLGTSLSSLLFLNGMIAAYLVKLIMKKCGIYFLMDSALNRKISGLTTDYLVVCAFMAVRVSLLGSWFVPVLAEAVVIAIVTFVVCFYFGQRFGGTNDFERSLGIFGSATGTVPTGLVLIRLVDPDYKTDTAIELGLMNITMILSAPGQLILLALISGTLSMKWAMLLLAFFSMLYLLLLKITGIWGQKTYSWKQQKTQER